MIELISGAELNDKPQLAVSMFRDRAWQFKERLNWDVQVNDAGLEVDDYDLPDTLYAIETSHIGLHLGSMRFRPTVSRNMISEHFSHVVPNVDFKSPFIWECTRFCISRTAPDSVAHSLLAAGAKLMQLHDLASFVAVFDSRMTRLYRRYGVSPEVLGSSIDTQGNTVNVGLWHNNAGLASQLLKDYETPLAA